MSATFPTSAADSPSLADPDEIQRQRAADFKALSALSPLNRFRIMFGRPLLPEPPAAFLPPPAAPPQAWRAYPDHVGFWWCWDAGARQMSCLPVDAQNLRVYLHHQAGGILSHPAGDFLFTPAPSPPPPPDHEPPPQNLTDDDFATLSRIGSGEAAAR